MGDRFGVSVASPLNQSELPPGLVSFTSTSARDRTVVGSKAAISAELRQAGLPVPEGFTITADLLTQVPSRAIHKVPDGHPVELSAPVERVLCWLSEYFGDTPVAVRSSALAEDMPHTSFAGLFETTLNVVGYDNVVSAVLRCLRSAQSDAVARYRSQFGVTEPTRMSVFVQQMISAESAGVAFGADPITGDPATKLITGTAGLGEGVVDGDASTEEWEIGAGLPKCRRPASILSSQQVRDIAHLLDRVEQILGAPQDMEWAMAAGKVWMLQARPMTSLPPPVVWESPYQGLWSRTIRFGELLPEPLTPLFATWLIDQVEDRFRQLQWEYAGFLAPAPMHVLLNGWYFHSPLGTGGPGLLWRGLLRRPRFAAAVLLAPHRPHYSEKMLYQQLTARWQIEWLPTYRAQVDALTEELETASATTLEKMADEIIESVGNCFWALAILGGGAWRSEKALVRFFDKHLAAHIEQPPQDLLVGLVPSRLTAYSVTSLDWIRPTFGELAPESNAGNSGSPVGRSSEDRRRQLESACLAALSRTPRIARRFSRLLEVAQRRAVVRAEVGEQLTYAWPLLREILRRIGVELTTNGRIAQPEDVFFLDRSEMSGAVADGAASEHGTVAAQRRAAWNEQRRLDPPLVIGRPPLVLRILLPKAIESVGAEDIPEILLIGSAASAGRAVGPVRILGDLSAAHEVRPGDILVVKAAVPALTFLFDRVSGLCVDGGSAAAHLSVVAREYGIPAVTGLRNATHRLHDGQIVVVDGTAGQVHTVGEQVAE